jgi:intergrase/recombinase
VALAHYRTENIAALAVLARFSGIRLTESLHILSNPPENPSF